MNARELERILPPSVRTTKVYLKDYVKGKDSVSFTYYFKSQKESHIKVTLKQWNKFKFEHEEDTVIITQYAPLTIITNESGWKRLGIEEQEDTDE